LYTTADVDMSHITLDTFHETGHKPQCLVNKLAAIAERIRERAYALYERRGSCGSALDDWLQAERDLILTPQSELIENDGKFEIRHRSAGISRL
jgi:hypothetical protein